jgi:hypothetical protein
VLEDFFIQQIKNTYEHMLNCKDDELSGLRQYLVALSKLEHELEGHINKYNLVEARRQYVG